MKSFSSESRIYEIMNERRNGPHAGHKKLGIASLSHDFLRQYISKRSKNKSYKSYNIRKCKGWLWYLNNLKKLSLGFSGSIVSKNIRYWSCTIFTETREAHLHPDKVVYLTEFGNIRSQVVTKVWNYGEYIQTLRPFRDLYIVSHAR
jgi:hypothetical protein